MRLITLVDKNNLQYLSRKIIILVMVYKPQTDIYIPALTRKNKINTSVTQRYHFDFILGTKRTWCSYDEDSRNKLESTTELKRQASKSVIRKDWTSRRGSDTWMSQAGDDTHIVTREGIMPEEEHPRQLQVS